MESSRETGASCSPCELRPEPRGGQQAAQSAHPAQRSLTLRRMGFFPDPQREWFPLPSLAEQASAAIFSRHCLRHPSEGFPGAAFLAARDQRMDCVPEYSNASVLCRVITRRLQLATRSVQGG
jgi:hypothetical protein